MALDAKITSEVMGLSSLYSHVVWSLPSMRLYTLMQTSTEWGRLLRERRAAKHRELAGLANAMEGADLDVVDLPGLRVMLKAAWDGRKLRSWPR